MTTSRGTPIDDGHRGRVASRAEWGTHPPGACLEGATVDATSGGWSERAAELQCAWDSGPPYVTCPPNGIEAQAACLEALRGVG
jgi:hypothetical protein